MASDWRIETRGFRELQKDFANAPRKIQAIGRQWAKDVAADEAKLIRSLAPARTGRFRRTIKPYSRAFVVGIQFAPYPKLGYKLKDWIIAGTRPHIIRPRRAKALYFFWAKRNAWTFSKEVHHPGTKPNDFVVRGVRAFDARVQWWMQVLADDLVKTLVGK